MNVTIPLFDAHCDTASRIFESGEGLRENSGHVDLARAGGYTPYAQFFAYWARRRGFDHLREMHRRFMDAVSQNGARLCVTAGEVRDAARDGAPAALLSVEGAELLDCDAGRLHEAYSWGVRAVNITWNYDNDLAGSCAGNGGGLTAKGFAFVREMGALGMIVDVSHLSDRGFYDVAGAAAGPFMASHSNSRALCPNRRNLTDEMFRIIIECGGVAGVNLYSYFLTGSPKASARDTAEHVMRFLELGGEKSICLGCDFDGMDSTPEDIYDISRIGKLYEELSGFGFPRDTLYDIFYNNLFRVLEEVCGT